VASAADFSADWFCCVIRATCTTVDPSPSCARSELPNAIALYQMIFNGSALFGPSIGGMLIPYIDTQGCFFTAAIGNLVVLVSIFTMQIPKVPRRISPPRLSEDMLEGMTLAWKTALFLSLFTLLAIVTFCTKPYTQFMPIFARDIVHVGAPSVSCSWRLAPAPS